ncbi:MAG: ABC transporter permease [Chloracidobacterium sp.]|nr:ABC transporter permease [Chloracidobacterium sp.]
MNKVFREILWPMVAVLAAFVVGGIIVLLIGDNPFVTFYHLIGNSFGSLNDIGYTLFIATPLIFTGLAVAVAFRCGLLNIGAEGQLYVAAFATAWVGIKFGGTVVTIFGKQEDWSWYSLPSVLLILVCMLTAVIAGGIWEQFPVY